MKNIFLVCREPRSAHWQLGPLPPPVGQITLLGWRQTPPPTDAGVPSAVATVLSRALTAVARVSFPSSTTNDLASSDKVQVIGGDGLIERIQTVFRNRPLPITLLSTCHPQSLLRFFDDAQYPWWLQGQVGLLSALEAPTPDCDANCLLALLGNDWAKRAGSLSDLGVLGILRPGVDGDVAGLLTFTHDFEEMTLAALEREVRLAGDKWSVLSEDAFAQHLADEEF